MSSPYFQKQSWPAFVYQGRTYNLTHLDESYLEVVDSRKVQRRMAVTFSDHCFTREPKGGDDPALRYARSSRPVGHFCFERYHLSLGLIGHIQHAVNRKVWNLQDDSFAIVPTINHRGTSVLYGIVFSLDRVTGLPIDLRMRIKTAYPCDIADIVTYGHERFPYLVTLRMRGKNPGRIVERHRDKPKVGWKPGQR